METFSRRRHGRRVSLLAAAEIWRILYGFESSMGGRTSHTSRAWLSNNLGMFQAPRLAARKGHTHPLSGGEVRLASDPKRTLRVLLTATLLIFIVSAQAEKRVPRFHPDQWADGTRDLYLAIQTGNSEIPNAKPQRSAIASKAMNWGMHLTPEAPRSSIRALEDYSRTLGSFKSASPSGFKVNRCRPPAGRNERRL